MGVNSFAIWPFTIAFFVYALAHAIMFLDWKIFVIALVLLLLSVATNVVVALIMG